MGGSGGSGDSKELGRLNRKERRKAKQETECGGRSLPGTPPPLPEMLGSLLVGGNIAHSKAQALQRVNMYIELFLHA